MKEILSFASYARRLKTAMKKPYNGQLKITQLLLEYLIMPDAENDQFTALNKENEPIFVDKTMASNLFGRKEEVHANIRKNCDLNIVINGIEQYFEDMIIPNLSPHLKADLIQDLIALVKNDPTIPMQKKYELIQNTETTSAFLSALFLYAVKKGNKEAGTKNAGNRQTCGANEQYYHNAIDNLFLHRSQCGKNIRLIDLYVEPKFQEMERYGTPYPDRDIFSFISRFTLSEDKDDANMLFIEGDAGAGKTSLVSYLTYHYVKQTSEWSRLFPNTELLCIRLRDIIPSDMRFSSDMIVKDILIYLGLETIQEFESVYRHTLLILDGFDELCMVEGISSDTDHYIYQIQKSFHNYKIIVTTRPQYLDIRKLNVNSRCITLLHLNAFQRKMWINKYQKIGVSDQEKYGIEYLLDEENDELDSICDTPMILYMIVAGGIDEKAKHNIWVLYHQIFYKELADTEYNAMFRNNEGIYSHGIKKYRNMLYRISSEIAYQMFLYGNKKLFITEQEINSIIDRMQIENGKTKEIIQHCYGLCNYWKANDKGAVEFYHNNIRDFFLCEKLYFELNEIYRSCEMMEPADYVPYINRCLYGLLHYMKLPQKVLEFVYMRTRFELEQKDRTNFPAIEMENRFLPNFFTDMLTYGGIDHYDRASNENVYSNMINTLFNVVQIFRHVYEACLPEKEDQIWWINKDHPINDAGILKNSFRQIFIAPFLPSVDNKRISPAARGNFLNISFQDLDLRYADFTDSNLEYSNFSNAILENARLENCNLRLCNFNDANLTNADLKNCNIEDCYFKGTILRNTILPDGSQSEDQQEQEARLKKIDKSIHLASDCT